MMQFLLVLALLALLAPAMAFRATPRFLASQSMLSRRPTQFIVNKNTMLFADEQEPSNAPDTPATEKNLKEQFDGALFNKDFQKNFWNTFNNVANLAIVALIVLRLSEFAASQFGGSTPQIP